MEVEYIFCVGLGIKASRSMWLFKILILRNLLRLGKELKRSSNAILSIRDVQFITQHSTIESKKNFQKIS